MLPGLLSVMEVIDMWSSYKDVKVCCYAICANEPAQFIDEWLESMNGADYICVLVTQRANPNYFQLREKQKEEKFKNKLIVDETGISPWRFDVARNESMKLIPEDSDVLICTDIDERLIPDFWDDLRKTVFEHPNFERIFYRYAWSHDDNGNPKWVFWYDKITQPKGWHWEFPVHEALQCDREKYHYNGQYYLDGNKIYLHHYPDNTKSRGSYLGLLEMRAEEYPDDLYGLFYLAREYSFVRNYQNALKTAFELYARINENPVRDDMRMLPAVLNMLGDFSNMVGAKDDAEYWYRKSIKTEPSFRDGYVKLAQLLAYQPRPFEVYSVLDNMYKNSTYREDWRLCTYYWRDWKVNQIIADAKCWEGKYDEAAEYMQKAINDLKTSDDQVDATRENLYADADFIKQKMNEKLRNSINILGSQS